MEIMENTTGCSPKALDRPTPTIPAVESDEFMGRYRPDSIEKNKYTSLQWTTATSSQRKRSLKYTSLISSIAAATVKSAAPCQRPTELRAA
jgi:hypothetical protein